jgi:hypothetical protein
MPGFAALSWRKWVMYACVSLPMLGCVWLVPPIDHSAAHCEFKGESACGTCLRTSCTGAIDACCGDSSCRDSDGHSETLDAVDSCAAGSSAACAGALGKGTSATASAVRACVVGTCKSACVGDAVVADPWSCDTARTASNDCSKCVYSQCASSLAECCGDSLCANRNDIVADIRRCVGGDKPGCSYLVTKSDYGYEGKVRACITKQCADVCMTDRMHQSCSLQSGGTMCLCNDAEQSSGAECSETSVGGTCVRGEGGCTCGHYSCTPGRVGVGCMCTFSGQDPSALEKTRCEAPITSEVGHCCLKRGTAGFSCECVAGTKPCASADGEYSVPSCNLSDALSKLSPVLVDRCSF